MLERPPVYIALFSAPEFDPNEPPIVIGADQIATAGTVPHGLSYDVARALPALWYCLHLPGSFMQVLDLPANVLKKEHQLSLGQSIWLAPVSVFESHWPNSGFGESGFPVLIITPSDDIDQTVAIAERMGIDCPVVSHSELSQATLRDHWRHIRSLLPSDRVQLEQDMMLSNRLDTAATSLPYRWLLRQLSRSLGSEPGSVPAVAAMIERYLETLLLVHTLASLEDRGVTLADAHGLISGQLEAEYDILRVPVALGVPGVPAAYSKRVYDAEVRRRIEMWPRTDVQNTWDDLKEAQSGDMRIERSAVEFLTAHRSVARRGIGLMLESIPQNLFQIVDQIERHCISKAYGPTVWKLLRRLYSASAPLWDDSLKAAVARASHLTVFSNFPVGLLRHPDASAPVLSRTPISYRPLMPLSRAIQYETNTNYSVGLRSRRVNVLVAECIPADDPVGQISRIGWQFSKEQAEVERRPVDFHICETLSVASFKRAIEENSCNILVISAHGFYNIRANIAGLMIGDEPTLGIGLGPLPSVVILSACHVSPMGVAAVKVVDMMLREGAMAILSTQIPVDVRHNATLMGRFFANIAEPLGRRGDHVTLADVWQHVQASNPINDIVNSNKYLAEWLLAPRLGKPNRLEEFMLSASVNRLRSSHIYSDTEDVLVEMAELEGIGDRVRRWLAAPGYMPESMFYVFWGSPERIFLNYPPVEEAISQAHDHLT